nr:unnamed protein product [Callosobruchus analis]
MFRKKQQLKEGMRNRKKTEKSRRIPFKMSVTVIKGVIEMLNNTTCLAVGIDSNVKRFVQVQAICKKLQKK